MGAKGFLRYRTARDAADYARWDARDSGGIIDVFDQQGQLYRKICIKADALAYLGHSPAMTQPQKRTRVIHPKSLKFNKVPAMGIEPILPRKRDFESRASTNSASI